MNIVTRYDSETTGMFCYKDFGAANKWTWLSLASGGVQEEEHQRIAEEYSRIFVG